MRWIIAVPALVVAGWLALDGTRALVTGDYITPQSGAYAGRLGPWADLVRAAGADPRSTPVKLFYASYGYVWLAVAAAYALGVSWGWRAMLVATACSLWFAPVGTALGLVQLILLLIRR